MNNIGLILIILAMVAIAVIYIITSTKEANDSVREVKAACNRISNNITYLVSENDSLKARNEQLAEQNQTYRKKLKDLGAI